MDDHGQDGPPQDSIDERVRIDPADWADEAAQPSSVRVTVVQGADGVSLSVFRVELLG